MDDEVRPPSDGELAWLEQAERYALHLLCQQFGDVTLDRTEADLRLVQALIDTGRLRADDVVELQCLGALLGNVFTARTEMRWAVVTNEFGELLAIHAHRIGFTLYPITMIAKRIEGGRPVDVPRLYRSFVDDLGLATS